jgi:hypothetical protein
LVRDELEARGLLDITKAFSSEVDTGSREENASKNIKQSN